MSVYFIADGRGHIKIGCSTNVKSRLASLQTATALKLTLLGWIPGGAADERYLHEVFHADRVVGEWFKYGPDLTSFGGFLVDEWRAGMTAREAVNAWIAIQELEEQYPVLFDQHGWSDAAQAG